MPWSSTIVGSAGAAGLVDALVGSPALIEVDDARTAPSRAVQIWWGPWHPATASLIGVATTSTELCITVLSDVDEEIALWDARRYPRADDTPCTTLLDTDVAAARKAFERLPGADPSAFELLSDSKSDAYAVERLLTRSALCSTTKGRALQCDEVTVRVRAIMADRRGQPALDARDVVCTTLSGSIKAVREGRAAVAALHASGAVRAAAQDGDALRQAPWEAMACAFARRQIATGSNPAAQAVAPSTAGGAALLAAAATGAPLAAPALDPSEVPSPWALDVGDGGGVIVPMSLMMAQVAGAMPDSAARIPVDSTS